MNKNKNDTTKQDISVRASQICVRAAAVLCTISLFLMPWAAKIYLIESFEGDDVTVPLLLTFYSCALFGFIILFALDRLITNISRGNIFVNGNIKLLRTISYCCFAIAVITLLFARLRLLAFIVTFAAAFIGLIIRVIKNCFTEAVRLREENDFTV